jgi:hypothetical protein
VRCLARHLSIQEPPDYREQRQYVPALGPRTLNILGDNNVGLVSIMGDEVIDQLLCSTGGEVRIYTATMRMGPTSPAHVRSGPAPTQGVQSEMWSLAEYLEGLGHSGLSVSAMRLEVYGDVGIRRRGR